MSARGIRREAEPGRKFFAKDKRWGGIKRLVKGFRKVSGNRIRLKLGAVFD